MLTFFPGLAAPLTAPARGPARRSALTLPLLVPHVLADDAQNTAAADHTALVAHPLD